MKKLYKKFNEEFSMKKILFYLSLYLFTFWIILSIFTLHPERGYDLSIIRNIIIFFATLLLTKYILYMVIGPWYDVVVARMDIKNAKRIKRYKPLVSIMIPAWNEEIGILHTIESLLKSKYRKVELIIINDGSTDNSNSLIRAFIKKYYKEHSLSKKRIDILYHYKQNEGKGAALNTAIEIAKGEILISIDADCLVVPDTIGNFVRYFSDPEVMAAVGNVKVGNTKNIIGVIQYLEFLFSFYFKKADSIMNTIYIIGGAAGAFRRKTLNHVGVYNTKNITEDIDLSLRIQVAGLKIIYASDAIVYTEGASDISGLMKQRLRWKRGRFETFFDNRQIFFSLKKKHNKLLCWIVLPLAYLGDIHLSFELFFLAILYAYSFLVNDFSSFISGFIVVSSMFFVQIFFDDNRSRKVSFYLLAPIGWLLFYIVTFVEFNALVKSIWGLIRKQELKWQKWQRVGLLESKR